MKRNIIKKRDEIRNTRTRTKETNALEYTQKLNRKWVGYVARHKDERRNQKKIFERTMREMKKRKPRWEDDVEKSAGTNWSQVAQDRKNGYLWRRLLPTKNALQDR